jgi:hypothetical protein
MKDYPPPDTRDEALAVLAGHVERDGVCEGCLASWAKSVVFPCSHVLLARRVLADLPPAS